jgi:pescadillo protein
LILSFGGQYLSADEIDEDDKLRSKVTHYIMDRPLSDSFLNANQNKEFVQPQYIVDSINNLYLLPTSQYKPGIPPPAHLSPFIDNEAQGYVPMRHKEIQHLKGEEVLESDNEEEEVEVKVPAKKEKAKKEEKVKPSKA